MSGFAKEIITSKWNFLTETSSCFYQKVYVLTYHNLQHCRDSETSKDPKPTEVVEQFHINAHVVEAMRSLFKSSTQATGCLSTEQDRQRT